VPQPVAAAARIARRLERPHLVELEPGRRFLERSPMLSMAFWQHERIVAPTPRGAEVVDNLTFRPRGLLPRALVRACVALFFRHRHARLRRRFGGIPLETT
jgi:hypothetical protein